MLMISSAGSDLVSPASLSRDAGPPASTWGMCSRSCEGSTLATLRSGVATALGILKSGAISESPRKVVP